jgi:hypothetical protein
MNAYTEPYIYSCINIHAWTVIYFYIVLEGR